MFQRKAKPKAGMAMIKGMVEDMAPHMKDSPFKVDNKDALIDSVSTQFSIMESAQNAPLPDLRTLLSESKTLSATKDTIAIRNAIINILESTYPNDEFNAKYGKGIDKDAHFKRLANTFMIRAYEKYKKGVQ